jgi:hypothetical protein
VSVDLLDYVDSLKREVSPPGTDLFAGVTDDVYAGYLADAFWEVRLDGFVEPYVADADGIITPATPGAPDISREDIALVILYAGIKIVRNRIMSTNTRLSAKAGPVEFTTESSANVLTEMLKELSAIKNRLLYLKTYNQDIQLIDAFSARSVSGPSYAGYLYDFYVGALGTNPNDFYGAYGIL